MARPSSSLLLNSATFQELDAAERHLLTLQEAARLLDDSAFLSTLDFGEYGFWVSQLGFRGPFQKWAWVMASQEARLERAFLEGRAYQDFYGYVYRDISAAYKAKLMAHECEDVCPC